MKQHIGFFAFTAAAMLLLPAAAVLRTPDAPASHAETSRDAPSAANEPYRVLDISTGEILTVPVRDYLIGAVCAEMPATFEKEALKAQAVAVHTYAERIRTRNRQTPDPSLLGADFSNDSAKYQAYYTEDQLHAAYGDAYDTCRAKIETAVDAVEDLLLCYDGEPIIAAFHAISSGKTESAETVWGEPLAYLVSVDSQSDRNAPRYQETVSFSAEDFKTAILRENPDVTFPDDPAQWCTVLGTSDAGTVLNVQCGSTVMSGTKLRETLGLRSACFSVQFADNLLQFTTKGYGHTIGMSQYGANAMAQNGSSYQEILAHYYPDTTLQSVS